MFETRLTPAQLAPKKNTRKKAKATKPSASAPLAKTPAMFGVIFMAGLSSILNGYAYAQHAPSAVAGWLLGIAVPVIVLTLGRVAGAKHRAKQKALAVFTGAAGAALLFLSVWHCSESIAAITGGGIALAIPMAIAIDLGFLACELALITDCERNG